VHLIRSTERPCFEAWEAIVEAACDAGNSIVGDPARITLIGTRQWATIPRHQAQR
jgi:hypothetical protein